MTMEQARLKILVVDDTKTNIEVLEGILSNDYDVCVAGFRFMGISRYQIPYMFFFLMMVKDGILDKYPPRYRLSTQYSPRRIPRWWQAIPPWLATR